ncbi:hypothetical protein niasHT_014620 [Heterodera trifolii]|uniref:Pseudouridylate synthase RPUSD4, mitochondrial n=1 Tax=Heterodera trifolii TaxID=157864 RepID=A0ABD2LI76_9BILA
MAMEDDFFGIKSLDSMPLPQFYQQRAKVPKSAFKRRGQSGGRDAKTDVFEAHFFPELSEKEEQEKMDEKNSADVDAQTFIEEQFFPRSVQRQQQQMMPPLDSPPTTTPEIGTADDGAAELFELDQSDGTSGIKQLWALVDPIWKFGRAELVDYMAKRVIYETDDLIALDKPFQMAFSSGPDDQPQLDRILQDLKKHIAPKIDRLFLVSSLDKNCSGVIVFAKSQAKQLEIKAQLQNDALLFRYRAICKGVPKMAKARISIPLIKVLRGSNLKFCPLVGEADERQQLYHLNTDIRMVNENPKAQCALLDAFERRGISHLVRSHLYYGLNCPVVGDRKYVKAHLKCDPVLETAISPNALAALSLRKNDMRKMPMFLHRAEVHIPWTKGSDGTVKSFHMIHSEIPPFFVHALKKLHLLKK